ncbi:MAG: hypothetical protein GY679_02175 [Mycoplasma sp.]|nr:hypothetical protein [Mycoplasma sp.]
MRIYLLIVISFVLLSCSNRIYGGYVHKKEIEQPYYKVHEYSDYDTRYKTEHYIDYDGKSRTRQSSYEEYTGSTYTEKYYYEGYKVTVRGWNKKEEKIFEDIFVTKEQFNEIEIKQRIVLREKADKWYKLDKRFFSFSRINKNIKTGRKIYLGSDYRFMNDNKFEEQILPRWIEERRGDNFNDI